MEGRDVAVRETVNASKEKFGEEDALALLKGASKVVVAKGKKVVEYDLAKDPPPRKELAAHVLGPTGNLRAPAIRVGKTWLVGFHEEVYADRFG